MRQLGVAFRAGATLSCRTCFVIIFEECYDLRNLENTIFFTTKKKIFQCENGNYDIFHSGTMQNEI